MVYYLFGTLYVLACLLLLLVVLLQQGKGGDIAAAFGGASSQTAFGARAGATVLTRATAVLGSLFLLGAFSLTLMGRNQGGSVITGVGGPPPATESAPALPTAPPPGTPTPGQPTSPAPAPDSSAPGSSGPVEAPKPAPPPAP